MKVTIDTNFTPHRVEIDGDCTIGELIEFLSKYYGDFTWKDVKIAGTKYVYNGLTTGLGTITTPNIQTWPGTGGNPYTIGTPFPGSTITYCSDNNTFTNSVGDTVQVNSLADLTS